jgi:hypothetical protein
LVAAPGVKPSGGLVPVNVVGFGRKLANGDEWDHSEAIAIG